MLNVGRSVAIAATMSLAYAEPARALVVGPEAAAMTASGPFDYQMVKVADDVYAFIEAKMNSIVSSNVVAVIGNDAVLVFDTGHHPPITRAIISDLKRITTKPVRYVVISHWHDDHWLGNAEFADSYPGVQIIAHPFTAKMMESRKDSIGGTPCRRELIEQSKPLRETTASGKRADGTPMSDASKERLTFVLDGFDANIKECDEVRFRGADRMVDQTLELDLGGRMVNISFLGRGNTAGDLIAFLPEGRILLTGDLLVHPFPFATQSYIGEWAKVLRHLDSANPAIIVPGHGPVLHDRQYLNDVADVLESVDQQARAAYKPGMTADQLRGVIDLTKFREKFSHGNPFIIANFDNMIGQSAIDRVWQQLSGHMVPEG